MADLLNELFCPLRLTGIAAALTAALGVEAPKQAEPALEIMKDFTHGRNIDRVLIYNPDAVALWLFGKYTDIFQPVMLSTQLTLPLKTVMPSVTPVCFATMYTGATPDVHGIKAYRKPVVKTDSVFDALIRAGKKPCIVSTGEDSMSKIFLEREMDYFIVSTPDEANAKAVELIKEDKYDLICVYNGNYDSVMHKVSPEGKEAIEALRHNSAAFKLLADAVRENWKNHTTLIGYAPDHGCHEIDGESGGHGLEMPEDMNIIHFYGVI
ncbi:MAG: alkaline phosphatase family protein [Clostridia bacterium]|nr:alkaline phosphatase family protein [Clostridia bacterium]MBQ7100350.1 alkaline phosphatase family protein [Clostridia bacterium]